MIRIAVCLSGQLRSWKISLPNQLRLFRDSLPDNVSVDFFGHAWAGSQPYIFPLTYNTEEPIIEQHSDDEFIELNNLVNFKNFKTEEFVKFDLYLGNYPFLFYSACCANALKEKYENENNFKYDVVIKSRYDIAFPQKLNVDTLLTQQIPLETRMIYLDKSFYSRQASDHFNVNLNDIIFFSASATMDTFLHLCYITSINSRLHVCSILPTYRRLTEELGPGAIMDLVARTYNFNIFPVDNFDSVIVRPAVKDAVSNVMNDNNLAIARQIFLDSIRE